MKRIAMQLAAILPILALALIAARTDGQELLKAKKTGAEKPAAKVDPAVIAKLIQQLGSPVFKTREDASKELAKLDEVPDVLREAAKNADIEIARRAQVAINIVTARAEEKAFQTLIRGLNKFELDLFVRRMVADEKFAGDEQWGIIQSVAKAVTIEANKLSERQFDVPDFNVKAMKHMLLDGGNKNPVSAIGSVVLSAGSMPYITGISKSIVVVDGDFAGATRIDNSLLIVRGNIGRITRLTSCIILATGHFEGATGCDSTFLQVNNQEIRFTRVRDCVLMNTKIKTRDTTNRVLDADKGPLQLLKFSPRKEDE